RRRADRELAFRRIARRRPHHEGARERQPIRLEPIHLPVAGNELPHRIASTTGRAPVDRAHAPAARPDRPPFATCRPRPAAAPPPVFAPCRPGPRLAPGHCPFFRLGGWCPLTIIPPPRGWRSVLSVRLSCRARIGPRNRYRPIARAPPHASAYSVESRFPR